MKKDEILKESVLASLPSGSLTATSDYVSSAVARLEGVSGYWTQDGGDGVFGGATSDDISLKAANPDVRTRLADDDGTSASPLQFVLPADIDLLRFDSAQSGTRVEETAGAAPKDHGSILTPGRVAAVDSTDDLPYGTVTAQAAGKTVIERVEDWAGAPAAAYAATGDSDDELSTTAYTFTFFRYGDHDQASALGWSGTADRSDDGTTGLRKVGVEAAWKGEELDLFDDDVLSAADSNFDGWVVIDLPQIWNGGGNAPLEAGEYYSALTPGIGVKSGDVTVNVWNGSGYDTVFDTYDGLGNCTFQTITIPATTPISVAEDGAPHLEYTVSGTITVNSMCVGATQQYGTGEVQSNSISATDIVSGTLQYTVVDTVGKNSFSGGDAEEKATLFDLTLTFSAGGVQATAVYINPELS